MASETTSTRQSAITDLLQYKCFFFDFDGVILESANIKSQAFVEMYKGSGFEEDVLKYHLANQGISRFVKFAWIAENLVKEKITDENLRIKGEQFTDLVYSKILEASFVPGVLDFLRNLRMHGKYIVVASGTPQDELKQVIAARGIGDCFDEVWGTPMKKTEIIEKVLEEKGLEAKECLFIGDATTDFEAARKTGTAFFARNTAEMKSFWDVNPCTYISDDFLCVQW